MGVRESFADLTPTKILLGYLLFGGVWILFSDWLANLLIQSQSMLTQIQTIKGWLFVFASGVLILVLVEARERQLRTSQDQLSLATEEVRVLHRVFRHDIRNDLNVIQGYIELVREDLDEDAPRADLNRAYVSSQRVLDTCEKFRHLEAAHEDAVSRSIVPLRAVIDEEINRVEERHPGVTILVEGPEAAAINGDRSLGYAIRELFENAVVHHHGSAENCRIEVVIEESTTDVTVTIVDNGPGITQYELEALEHGTESPLTHSSGVGLWLVKWLCNVAGGEFEVEQLSDGGTRVTLTFEAAQDVSRTRRGLLRSDPD